MMNLTIEDLMVLKEFSNAYLLSGKNALTKKVTSITIMDIPTIDEWIKPNELLIVGTFFENTVDAEFMIRLNEKNCSGIITKEKFTKHISEDSIKLANELNFPIIVVSDVFSWSELMTPITQAIIKLQQQLLLESDHFQSALINSVLMNHSFENMCTSIAPTIHHSIAIIDEHNEIVDASSDFDWTNALRQFSINKNSSTVIGFDFQDHPIMGYVYTPKKKRDANEYQLVVYPIQHKNKTISNILIKIDENTTLLEKSLILKIQSFAQILVLKYMIYSDIYQANLYYHDLILDEILNLTHLTSTQKIKFELTIGHLIENNYYISIFQLPSQNNKTIRLVEQEQDITEFLKMNYENYSKIIVFIKDEKLIIFLGESIDNPEKAIEKLLSLFQYYFSCNDIYAGISQLQRFEKSYVGMKEAKQALNTLTKIHSPKNYQFYTELGFLRLLTDKKGDIDNIYFEELLHSFIYPIIDYDTKNNTQLLDTLKVLFKNNLSNKKTSDELYIHKNTLRARMKRIEDILSIDTTNNDDMLNMQIALKIYESIN